MVSNLYFEGMDMRKASQFVARNAAIELRMQRQRWRNAIIFGILFVACCIGYFIYDSYIDPEALREKLPWERKAAAAADAEKRRAAVAKASPVAADDNTIVAPERKRVRKNDSELRTIVLWTEDSRINTGVWPGWGDEHPTLNWAASGVEVVKKGCSKKCIITHDNSYIAQADAIVMELINHPKFGLGDQAVAYPEKNRKNRRKTDDEDGQSKVENLPIFGIFGYEPASYYKGFNMDTDSVREIMDFSILPSQRSTVPINLICPWGRPVSSYLLPPPPKQPGRLVAHFSEHGAHGGFNAFLDEFFAAAGENVHAYMNRRNRELPAEASGDPFRLTTRLDFLGTYKFILIAEEVDEDDFVSPEFSQALLSGTVPVYIGAKNIASFAPGPRSFVNARDFASGQELWDYLRAFDSEHIDEPEAKRKADLAYSWFFRWKSSAKAIHNRYEASVEEESQDAFVTDYVGTGRAVQLENIDRGYVADRVNTWPRPDPATVDEDPENAVSNRDEGVLDAFHDVSESAWKLFREKLDQCVHYAECRICEVVHNMT